MHFRRWLSTLVAVGVVAATPVLASPRMSTTPSGVPQTVVSWGGMEWLVSLPVQKDPAGHPLSDSTSSVFVDGNGALHLSLVPTASGYEGVSLTALQLPGYGTYRWTVDRASMTSLATCAVLGMFIYSNQQVSGGGRNQELDIEDGHFCRPLRDNVQYVVQPYWAHPARRANVTRGSGTISQQFTWSARGVDFATYVGGRLLSSYGYVGDDIPSPARTTLHTNLWLDAPNPPPAKGQRLDVVLPSFTFTPSSLISAP